jgi:hypothetical protein
MEILIRKRTLKVVTKSSKDKEGATYLKKILANFGG